MRLEDEKSVRARIDGPQLRIEVVPGFIYGRFNRPDVLEKFSAAATALAGHDVRAILSTLEDKAADSKRSLDDLKAFKEVRFI